ncbi:MAG: hypothetical protein ACK559_25680, partial [bacterium]
MPDGTREARDRPLGHRPAHGLGHPGDDPVGRGGRGGLGGALRGRQPDLGLEPTVPAEEGVQPPEQDEVGVVGVARPVGDRQKVHEVHELVIQRDPQLI